MSKKGRNYILFTFSKYWNEAVPSWKASYYSKDGLIHKLALSEVYEHRDNILDNLVDTMDVPEIKRVYVNSTHSYFGGYYTYTSVYYIAKVNSGEMRKVNVENLKVYIEAEILRIREKREKEHQKCLNLRKFEQYTFRKGSVPGIHKYRGHRGSYYRHPETTKSKRNEYYIDDEYTIRDAKIRTLPSVYDDLVRHTDKSWKTSCKVRKQWMKHNNKHVDTLKEFNKRNMTDWDLE